ncbi:MAG: pantoate--beta-alanine ligase [Pirellulales bacterium]
MANTLSRPVVVTTRNELRAAVAAARAVGRSIGFVPTMGALHAGHLSLVEAARRDGHFTVVSIFVNPTQFAPGEDFERYPRPLEADLGKLADQNVDLVFAPPTEEIYRPGSGFFVEVGPVGDPLEGRCRPGHFRGVATVVLKLFNLAAPDVAYFGRKDYQQTLVVRRMAEDFDLPVEVRVCPTVREPDGLALSSRNVYLSPTERQQALVLSESLRLARQMVERGERHAAAVLAQMQTLFTARPAVQVEYIALADGGTLADAATIDRGTVALIAARVGRTRLIDNEPIGEAVT